jgi:hypothetical protein
MVASGTGVIVAFFRYYRLPFALLYPVIKNINCAILVIEMH